MRRKVIAITAGCVAALVFAAQPASAIGAVPAVHSGETNAPIVQEIGQKGHHGHQYRHHLTTTTMGIGTITGPTTATVIGPTTTMVVMAIPIPTGAAPA